MRWIFRRDPGRHPAYEPFKIAVAFALALAASACSTAAPNLAEKARPFILTMANPGDGTIPPSPPVGNGYPIVLVGGVGCWGRDELPGLFYFGGFADIQAELTEAGQLVVTSAVGPVSSHWDRACELYAQIKGRRVDYGAAHARAYGHERWGRDYSGKALVPGWGASIAKAHFITHSMGGPTVRALVFLLESGSPENDPGDDPDSLFSGGKHWASGVVTVSATHDGTSMTAMRVPVVGNLSGSGFQQFAIGAIAVFQGRNAFFDFKLDQFGLTKRPDQSLYDYYETVKASPLWERSKDLATWDVSPEGARELNRWAATCPDVYYFSWATDCTDVGFPSGHSVPDPAMNPAFAVSGSAAHLGSYTQSGPGLVTVDSSWWRNDGIVNTCSMDGPTTGCPNLIVRWDGTARAGLWNYLGCLEGVDHVGAIGFGVESVVPFYLANARLLASLPQ